MTAHPSSRATIATPAHPRRRATPGTATPAHELCGWAGHTITRAYRLGLPGAGDADEAHGRLWARTRGRGTVPADDPDVGVLLELAGEVSRVEEGLAAQERERLARAKREDRAEERRRREVRAEVERVRNSNELRHALDRLARRPSLRQVRDARAVAVTFRAVRP